MRYITLTKSFLNKCNFDQSKVIKVVNSDDDVPIQILAHLIIKTFPRWMGRQ